MVTWPQCLPKWSWPSRPSCGRLLIEPRRGCPGRVEFLSNRSLSRFYAAKTEGTPESSGESRSARLGGSTRIYIAIYHQCMYVPTYIHTCLPTHLAAYNTAVYNERCMWLWIRSGGLCSRGWTVLFVLCKTYEKLAKMELSLAWVKWNLESPRVPSWSNKINGPVRTLLTCHCMAGKLIRSEYQNIFLLGSKRPRA